MVKLTDSPNFYKPPTRFAMTRTDSPNFYKPPKSESSNQIAERVITLDPVTLIALFIAVELIGESQESQKSPVAVQEPVSPWLAKG